MLKRLCLGTFVLAAAGSAVLAVAAPAHSDRADWSDPGAPPPHGHMLLNDAVIENRTVISFEGCRELANGEVVPRSAHHENLHVGRAGAAQRQAGNAVVPLAPASPYGSCEDLTQHVYGGSS